VTQVAGQAAAVRPGLPARAGADAVTWEDLTPEQREVVQAREPTMLVGGGAGVGKTTTALWAARVELTRLDTPPYKRVLFLTFSRTAVAQILSRSRKVLTGIGDRVEILTFHGLAYQLVRRFGRYGGGPQAPTLRGDAESKLAVGDTGALSFDDLLPRALALLAPGTPLRDLLLERYSMVICDEFQDTDDQQWQLLELLGERARLLLLTDPNQMIYGWRPGVHPGRLTAALARPGARQLLLPSASLRDPSQVLPAAAEDIRRRRFDTDNVRQAISAARLVVYRDVGRDGREQVVADQLAALQEAGCATIGVFLRTNAATAELSAALVELGVDHVPIGFPEAYGEALSAMATLLAFSAGRADWEEVKLRLAVFMTAINRSPTPPAVATALLGDGRLPAALVQRVGELRRLLSDVTDPLEEGADIARRAWPTLGVTGGWRPWNRAATTFGAMVARARLIGEVGAAVEHIRAEVRALRSASFVELDGGDTGAVQLMNFSQTKGREADATVLVFDDEEYFGKEGEPFSEASRLLYVAMTRARRRVVVLLPRWPHPLVAPLLPYAVPLPAR
jgi:DNA helicase II / ATP-dependent DNA helicase PcrA